MIIGDAKNRTLVPSVAIAGVVTVAGLALPLDPALQYTLIGALAWAIAAIGLDVLVGFTGQVSFGQAAFVAIGAYATSAFRLSMGLPLVLAVVLGVGVTGVIALALGSVVVRYRIFGIATATLFFGYVVVTVLTGDTFSTVFGGANGLAVPEFAGLEAGGKGYLAVTGVVLILVVVATCLLNDSQTGRAFRMVKTNEAVAASAGIRVRQVKMISFAYCCVLAAIAGVLYSGVVGYLSPEGFGIKQSVNIFAMLVVGGAGTVGGPILGALLVTILPGYLLRDGHVSAVVFAAVLLVFLILLPEGIYGLVHRWATVLGRTVPGLSAAALRSRSRWATAGRAGPRPPAETPPDRRSSGSDTGGLALEVDGLQVRFGDFVALSQVDVRIESGSVHAIVGPNGAGKTTLLNTVCGLYLPSQGDIRIFGSSIRGVKPHRIRDRGVVRTFQTPAIVPDLDVVANVKLGLDTDLKGSLWTDLLGPLATGGRERVLESRAQWALDAVGIAARRRGMLARNLDLSEQKRVELARGLVGQGRLLLLDEPTAGLSADEMQALAQTLRQVHRDFGLTIMVVSHHIGFIRDIADAMTVLDYGRVVGTGTPDDVLARADIAATFMGVETAPLAEAEDL
ncbi:branched-chain amino acid ABC transporter ATP-binding protein/permease [Nakamurella endophytica]|uniref:Branched-chain amino acid ABC transporter permease n=1 Tax=Nakamurella endophytica TaxID=1748367 RepID=A0A917STG7_9ACTN|nr:ATP-binding cassette domain-containing protein [Nakamurella endophytica]GGL94751.1 branched-chain amino acid ABC transporter permease [Nakamurella endophytica]